MSMIGTKGYFLKIIAMSGAIDLEGIRIFYQTHNGRRVKDKNMKILRENGYIQKAVFRRKSYYHLTQKGKDIVLAGEVKNTLDCSEYLTGNVVTNIMPLSYKDNKDKVQRCIYQGRILAEMYQGRIPIFWTYGASVITLPSANQLMISLLLDMFWSRGWKRPAVRKIL